MLLVVVGKTYPLSDLLHAHASGARAFGENRVQEAEEKFPGLPSDAEGFSMAVLEALASSTAVLLSPGCHFPEVEDAGAGRIASTDPTALADALRDMVVDRQMLNRMGAAGLRLVTEHYIWERITDSMLDVYAEGIGRHRATI